MNEWCFPSWVQVHLFKQDPVLIFHTAITQIRGFQFSHGFVVLKLNIPSILGWYYCAVDFHDWILVVNPIEALPIHPRKLAAGTPKLVKIVRCFSFSFREYFQVAAVSFRGRNIRPIWKVLVKMEIVPKRAENKKYWEPPPRISVSSVL